MKTGIPFNICAIHIVYYKTKSLCDLGSNQIETLSIKRKQTAIHCRNITILKVE